MPVFLEPSLTKFSIKLRDWDEKLTVDLVEFPCSILTGINASGKTLSMNVLRQFCDMLIDYDEMKEQRLTALAVGAGVEEIRVRFEYEWFFKPRDEEPSKLHWFALKEDYSGYNSTEELESLEIGKQIYTRRLGSDLSGKEFRYGSRRIKSSIIIDFEAKVFQDNAETTQYGYENPIKGELQFSRRDGISFDVSQMITFYEKSPTPPSTKIMLPPLPRFERRAFREVIIEDGFRKCSKEDLNVCGFGPNLEPKDFRGDLWRKTLADRTGIAFDYIEDAGERYFFEDPKLMISFRSIPPRLLTVESAYEIDEETRKSIERDISAYYVSNDKKKSSGEVTFDFLISDIAAEFFHEHRSSVSSTKDFNMRFCGTPDPTDEELAEALEEISIDLDLGGTKSTDEFIERYSTHMAFREMYGWDFANEHNLVDYEHVPPGEFSSDDYSPVPITFNKETREYDIQERLKRLLLVRNRDFGLFHSLGRFLPFIHERLPEHFSSGQKRIISLLHNISLSPHGSTILIDEPELSMHIDWQEKMVSALIESFPKHKFILATHAPSMVKDHHDLIFQVPPSDDT